MAEGPERRIDVGAAAYAEPQIAMSIDIGRLFEVHHKLVFRAAYRITGNATDAEDVMQGVFLRLLKSGLSTDVSNTGSYLYRSAVNAALDLMRSRSSAPMIAIDDTGGDTHADPSPDPFRTQASTEIREWLRQTVARLHPTAAEMFTLRFIEGKDNVEIAELMGTTPGTVAVTLHRTRDRVQHELRAAFGEGQ